MYSQIGQDEFVRAALREKKGGFFVEIGAANGLDLSNTLLFEREYDWTGILCEPALEYQSALTANRKCKIVNKACAATSGETIPFRFKNLFSQKSVENPSYWVETISLNDLLLDVPHVDYMSIDVEGMEVEILSAFNFKTLISVITVEHNYRPDREIIYSILTSNGFVRQDVNSQWDDFYLAQRLINERSLDTSKF